MWSFRRFLWSTWLEMIIPPWRDVDSGESCLMRTIHTMTWVMGWTWFLAGALFGGIVAPYVLDLWGLANTRYEIFVFAILGAVCGFVVQLEAWFAIALLSNFMP